MTVSNELTWKSPGCKH